MRRLNANSLLWFGLMVWALGQVIVFTGLIGDWPGFAGPSNIGYDTYRFGYDTYQYCSAIGAFFICVGAALKVIGSLRAD